MLWSCLAGLMTHDANVRFGQQRTGDSQMALANASVPHDQETLNQHRIFEGF